MGAEDKARPTGSPASWREKPVNATAPHIDRGRMYLRHPQHQPLDIVLLRHRDELVYHAADEVIAHDHWQRVVIGLRHLKVVQPVVAGAWRVDDEHYDRPGDGRAMRRAARDVSAERPEMSPACGYFHWPRSAKRGHRSSGGNISNFHSRPSSHCEPGA